MTKIEHSGKLVLLMDILRQCELIGDKVLVFSQSLFSLELIEEFLAEENLRNEANRATLKSGVCISDFCCGIKYSIELLSHFSAGRRKSGSSRLVDC